ncbi:MAG: hypothetical protein JNL08_09720 [Planctomycetes bacterium]|nr:hypothetical protein [Planctomycetota bacterium]
MSKTRFVPCVAALAGLAPSLFAQIPITPGNLIVTRLGDGAAALSAAAAPVFLEEFTQAGAPVQTIAMPVALSGPNQPITNAGNATSEGFITQSADGSCLVTVGYGAVPGTAAIASTASATTPRVVSRIRLDGSIDTSTALTDSYSASNIRSATSLDGNQFWTAGTASAVNRGVCYVGSVGATTSTQLSTTVTNLRVVNIFDNQLYVSSQSGSFVGVNTVGTGLPTTSGETITRLNGFPGAGSPNQYDFWFADANTVYVADERATGSNGGIQKWVLAVGTWTNVYTLHPGVGCRAVTGYVDNGTTYLFAVTAGATTSLVSTTDGGSGPGTWATLATSATNTAFRGVRFVRTPNSVTFGGSACPTSVGDPTIGTTGGAPVAGNANFGITVGNAPDFLGAGVGVTLYATAIGINAGLPPFGFPIPDAPACALLFAFPDLLPSGLTDVTGAAVIPLPLTPAESSLWGLSLAVQHAVWDLTGFYSGFGLPIGMSQGMQIVIGN